MSFLNRENRQQEANQPVNRNFGRGLYGNQDLDKAEKKAREQQAYKQQLQRQIQEREERKRKEQEKIRLEDEKFMREIEEINRKQNSKKQQEKNKQVGFQQQSSSPQISKPKQQKIQPRRPLAGNLNVSLNYEPERRSIPDNSYEIYDAKTSANASRSERRIIPYSYEENSQFSQYYEERMRKHKQTLNQRIDELFHHIHSTKDNIKADEEVERIKQRLKGKHNVDIQDYIVESKRNSNNYFSGGYEQYSKFYDIPKKSYENTKSPTNQSRLKSLDYQSQSKYGLGPSRGKMRTHYGQEIQEEEQDGRNSRWGRNPGKDNYLGNREALDFQIEKTLGGIDQFLGHLKQSGAS